MRLIGQFRLDQEVVTSEDLCRLQLVTVLVEVGEGDGVADAAFGFFRPDGGLDEADADFRVMFFLPEGKGFVPLPLTQGRRGSPSPGAGGIVKPPSGTGGKSDPSKKESDGRPWASSAVWRACCRRTRTGPGGGQRQWL